MYSRIFTGLALGIEGRLVSVETDIGPGLPGFSLVGSLSASAREAVERVRSALRNTGITLPARRITVNLAPADLRKEGTAYDLAIAVSILGALEILPEKVFHKKIVYLGELGLDGSLQAVPGVLPVVHFAALSGFTEVVVPEENAPEAALIPELSVYPAKNLQEVISLLDGSLVREPFRQEEALAASMEPEHDIREVRGQEMLKRGMTLAAAGFHNILMTGAAGAGKSLIAKCLPGIQPEMTPEEQLVSTKIYSVAGRISEGGLMRQRPFRSPHHTITTAALLGGGGNARPGEVSLASGGVLFLDEFPEFRTQVIECLRQPLEERSVTISRMRAAYTYPADFMLVAARNNCPCGYYPDRTRCSCTEREIIQYRNRISQPIMDRIDMNLTVRPVSFSELTEEKEGVNSAEIREAVAAARERQSFRYRNEDFKVNAGLTQNKIEQYISLTRGEKKLLEEAFLTGEISARGYFRILRLARTAADLAGAEEIREEDIREALFFRNAAETRKEVWG